MSDKSNMWDIEHPIRVDMGNGNIKEVPVWASVTLDDGDISGSYFVNVNDLTGGEDDRDIIELEGHGVSYAEVCGEDADEGQVAEGFYDLDTGDGWDILTTRFPNMGDFLNDPNKVWTYEELKSLHGGDIGPAQLTLDMAEALVKSLIGESDCGK